MMHDYELFLLSIYFAGVITGGVVGAIILAYEAAQRRKRDD